MSSKLISQALVQYWKLVPILVMLVLWIFFTGFRTILRTREQRLARELLLCLSCFGFLFALLCYGSYALVDPANGLARQGAPAPLPAELDRLGSLGGLSLTVSLVAGLALEILLRRRRA